MTEHDHARSAVDQFVQDQIDTVPHLEALLLLWNRRPKPWTIEDMARGLFLAVEAAKEILEDLARQGLIVTVPGEIETYYYVPEEVRGRLIGSLDSTYRRELIRVVEIDPPKTVGRNPGIRPGLPL